jgi:two-component system chemotaxis response regulator CheY
MSFDWSKPVLVVDDYQTVIRIMRNLLRQAGFSEIDEARDGEEALTKMRERQYGLVISDLHMAPVDGFELVRKAKADEALKDTPIILVSGDAVPDNVVKARDAGAAAYVVKPFDSETLKARISSAVAA